MSEAIPSAEEGQSTRTVQFRLPDRWLRLLEQHAADNGLSRPAAIRQLVTAGLALQERIQCPVHGIPDCSPLLNGCSLVLRLTAYRAHILAAVSS